MILAKYEWFATGSSPSTGIMIVLSSRDFVDRTEKGVALMDVEDEKQRKKGTELLSRGN